MTTTNQTPEPDVCEWSMDLDSEYAAWETKCGNAFWLNDGTPKENDMRFCCYCGKKLVERTYNSITEDEE